MTGSHPAPGGPATRYLVEWAGASDTQGGIQALAERARQGAAQVGREGSYVRFLRAVFVPDDGSCFLVFEADSEQAIERAIACSGIGAGRVAPAISIPVGEALGP